MHWASGLGPWAGGLGRWASAALLAATLCSALFASLGAAAQVPVPPLTGHVSDQTGTLTPEQQATLEQTLAAFEARKGSQLAVLMVRSTAPEDIAQYALRVAEQWQLGRKKVDDGAILVVAKDDRALRIEVGYGLEGVLTDLGSQRIINETILPRFRQQDFFGGISAGVAQMVALADGEALPPPRSKPVRQASDVQSLAPVLLVVALAVGGVLRAVLGKLPGALVTGGVVAGIAWFMAGALAVAAIAGLIAMGVTLFGGGLLGRGGLGHHGRGGFSGGGAFSGGGGGGGGGGYSGGGGGFGGGGASGRW
ncbi:TPM domain-containing protein [Aquabacterium sp.]|uniref:TPM domain-containing protein n=1 Tax=Aquabacterium sp. TaxID=1872578 RepID=UPI0039C8729D